MDKVAERISRSLKSSIVSREMEPGLVITEKDLTERFQCSRTPVREALQRLSLEGYIAVIPRRGYLVTAPSVRDTAESYHLRELLEGEAARLAAGRLSPGLLEGLQECLESEDDVHAVHRRFHLLIADASGSRRLKTLVDQLIEEMDRVVDLDPGMHDRSYVEEHREIIDALKSGSGEAAKEAMARHIQASRDRVMKRV